MWLSYPKVSWHKVFCISTGSWEYLGANTTVKVHINFSTADNHVWNFCPHQRESFQRGNSNSVTLHVRWAVFLMPEWDPHGLLLNIYFHVWHREPDSSIACGKGRKSSCGYHDGGRVAWVQTTGTVRGLRRWTSERGWGKLGRLSWETRDRESMHKSNRRQASSF